MAHLSLKHIFTFYFNVLLKEKNGESVEKRENLRAMK